MPALNFYGFSINPGLLPGSDLEFPWPDRMEDPEMPGEQASVYQDWVQLELPVVERMHPLGVSDVQWPLSDPESEECSVDLDFEQPDLQL